jgi:hypothetical protein
MEFYGSRTALWFQRTLSFVTRSWRRLIALGILSIQEQTRCIKIWRRTSGGHKWSDRLWNMCPTVTHVEESKPIIWGPPETYNPWEFLSENGKHLYGLHCGFALPLCGYNLIWVIVDRLMKFTHFIPVHTTYRVRQYAELYMSHIVRYHGISKIIISNKESIFVAHL